MKTTPILLACLLLAGCGAKEEEKEPKPVVEVKVAQAELADVQITVRAPATIFPREQAGVASKITAPIRWLGARKGDRVSAGQVLARLEDRDLLAQRTEAVDKARGEVLSAAAALHLAQKNLDRRQKLYDQGAIPQKDLLDTQTEAARAQAAFDVAQKFLELLESPARKQELRSASLTEQQQKIRQAFFNAQLEFTEIRSPFTGAITEQFSYPGDMAKPESPIFTVMDLAVAVARAQVPEVDVRGVSIGKFCAFENADRPGTRAQGRVSVVNQAVDPARRTVEVWCEIPNGPAALRAGEFGALTIITGVDAKSVVVPKEAVQFVEGTHKGFVMLVAGNTAKRVDVETGESYAGKVQIKQGLKAGDTVIVEGGYGLEDGTEVRVAGEKKP
ncbi:MAG TPA: efflux RND transporter periplasmic adaptor subunit [Candidatus Acidoferrales bacterium]|jgi:multidrug efflux pump subunit AcrA (membrane-fusion protein)|nr:efflux RND transporter periplasmic adaptor subunit [Candidatus Acidoferrales bacterium]